MGSVQILIHADIVACQDKCVLVTWCIKRSAKDWLAYFTLAFQRCQAKYVRIHLLGQIISLLDKLNGFESRQYQGCARLMSRESNLTRLFSVELQDR